MKKISVAFNCCYGARFEKQTYLPMIKRWGNQLEYCYGIGFPRGYQFTDEPLEHMILSKIPTRMKRFVFDKYIKIFKKPDYYPYLWQGQLFDWMTERRMNQDRSAFFLTRSDMGKCIDKAKSMGKKVMVLAPCSEPVRQYERYTRECEIFGISHRSIFGDREYCDLCEYGYNKADHIITISNVSNQTYLRKGYNADKLTMIPLTGTSFTIKEDKTVEGKKKAFISTAFHSMIKGTHRLLLAWKKAHIHNIPLIIVGTLSEDMKEFIEKYGPFENVIFTGHKNDLERFYDDYDAVGILMSFSEAAGRTTPELMSKGFPMIVSPDATCDIVVDGENGFVVEPTDERKLVETLHWFSDNWNHVYDMRKSVFDSVKNRKSVDFGIELADYILNFANK